MPEIHLLCRPVAGVMAAQVAQWQARDDRRAIFLDCYLRMTHNMLVALVAGEFHDTAWVDRLLDRFAGYYFDALRAYEQTRATTPAVWRIAHNAAGRPDTLTLQHLLLGVNAHINYDLVLVVVELLQPEWDELGEVERHTRYADYTHVNAIIARTIDEVQTEVVARATPALAALDALLGPLDEWATGQVIAGWREEVWRQAIAILTAPDNATRAAHRDAVEAAALRRASWLLGAPV